MFGFGHLRLDRGSSVSAPVSDGNCKIRYLVEGPVCILRYYVPIETKAIRLTLNPFDHTQKT
jgi:hypothetical protein